MNIGRLVDKLVVLQFPIIVADSCTKTLTGQRRHTRRKLKLGNMKICDDGGLKIYFRSSPVINTYSIYLMVS